MSEPAAAMTLQGMQAMLDGSPFIKLLAMKAVSLDRERQQVVIAMPMAADYERHPGTGQFHGGVIASRGWLEAGNFCILALPLSRQRRGTESGK